MSKVEELLAHYNPDGVNNVTFSSIGDFENIGVDKKIVEGEPLVTLLNYVDVYHNKTIKKGVPKMIVSSPVNKVDKCSVEKGDIFITPTSETVDDIGHSSLVLETLPQTVYSYHIMRYRLHDISMTTASYINQCFETRTVKEQILKKAQGLTRFGVSKNKFGEIEIPLPHIKVQEEIVKVLDSFTNLIDALNEELSLRQKQFEYYREKLLTFDDNVNWDLFDNIGEITDYVANGSFADLKKNVKYLQESNYAILVRTLDLSSNFKNNNFVYIDKNAYDFLEKSKLFGGEIIVNNVGAGVGTVFYCPKLERKMSLGPNSVVLKTDYNKFYYYWLSSKQGQDKIFQITSFSALPKFNKTSFKQILFPVIDEKIDTDYIVSKLDAFESLISSLKEEIALRQKQYEYYREKLLTFE